MKQFTIKELGELTNVASGTIRAWVMKPIDGKPYSSENVNYENLVEKLNKYFEDFETRFGFKASEIEIVKAERTSKKWIHRDALQIGEIVILHNYSLKTVLKFVRHIDDLDAYLFEVVDSEEAAYKVYTNEQLEKENMRIEVAEV